MGGGLCSVGRQRRPPPDQRQRLSVNDGMIAPFGAKSKTAPSQPSSSVDRPERGRTTRGLSTSLKTGCVEEPGLAHRKRGC
jgi:hypothetical protein